MASKRVLCAWACGVALTVVAAVVLGVAAPGNTAAPSCSDAAYLTWSETENGRHTLSIIDFETKRRTDVATLDFHVNAIGYSAADKRLYGLSRSRDGGIFPDAPHLISIDSDGAVKDWGPLRAGDFADDGLGGAYAGTVHKGKLMVLSGTRLTSIDIGEDRGRITDQVTLAEPLVSLNIGDVTGAPGSGLLHGLSTEDGAVVSIDPDSGAVERTAVTGIPARSLAGAIFAGPDRRLHAVVNGVEGRAVMYRMPVPDKDSGPLEAEAEADWPALTSADAAFCVAPVSHPQPGPSPQPSPATASPASPSPRESSPAAKPPPRPRPSRDHGRPPGTHAAAEESEKEDPRRWIAVGAVVIGMAGAAGVKASASRKSK